MNKKNLLLLTIPFILGACGNEEVEQRKQTRVTYDILDTYDYDKVKVVVEDEKTPAELAEDMLRARVGLSTGGVITYPDKGILEGQGVFVETAIADGDVIPTVSGFSDAEKEVINNNSDGEWESQLAESFGRLEQGREKSLASINNSVDEAADLTSEIEKAAQEQKERIAEQEKALEKQKEKEENIEQAEELEGDLVE